MKRLSTVACLMLLSFSGAAMGESPIPNYSVKTFPDPAGFDARIKGSLEAIAAQPFGSKIKASFRCPACNASSQHLAVPGETVTCPACKTESKLDNSSYFGPAKRDASGRITHFKGDPLKFELQPVTARLLLNPKDAEALAYASEPGLLRQHYHFAATNWSRFYPLLADKMTEQWRKDFALAVGSYREESRPSDKPDDRKAPPNHDYIGTPGELLGGPVLDGGTENHKTQWRVPGLLFAQILPNGPLGKDILISGRPAKEAETLLYEMLREYLHRSFLMGNGEWQSSTYYPYTIRAYMNLFDFSPDPKSRDLAQGTLDFYFAVYGLHLLNGTYAGPQKRGFVDGGPDDLARDIPEQMTWQFLGTGAPKDLTVKPAGSVHMATTTYRPNRVLSNLLTKNVHLPFEAKLTHPDYHAKQPNASQEYLFVDKNFALGSAYLQVLDNAGQQTVWSLVVAGDNGNYVFGGLQPKYRNPEGHTPYSQTHQHKNTLIVSTHARQKGQPNLVDVPVPETADTAALLDFWQKAPTANQTWFFIPRNLPDPVLTAESATLAVGNTTLTLKSFSGKFALLPTLAPNPARDEKTTKALDPLLKLQAKYKILIALPEGELSGYVLQVEDKTAKPLPDRHELTLTTTDRTIDVTTPAKETLRLTHQLEALRATAAINEIPIDFPKWANGKVVDSPYLVIHDGKMHVKDGKESYTITVDAQRTTFSTP